MMALYVQQLNLETKMLHEQQRKERKELSHPSETAEAVPLSEPNELELGCAGQGEHDRVCGRGKQNLRR